MGLSTKTCVVTGGMDQAVGAIGAGNFKPGKVSESTGAALAIQATITDPMIDRSKVYPSITTAYPGSICLSRFVRQQAWPSNGSVIPSFRTK